MAQNNGDMDDDYVPVHINGHKPQRPSFPGEKFHLGSNLPLGLKVWALMATMKLKVIY